MKKLMIVGASVLQLPAIKKAKEMGLYVGVIDYNPKAIGISFADKFFNVSTRDEEAIVKVAEKFKPDGIITLATDMPMRGVAKASERLKLHSISYETALRATDKHEMLKAFKEHNVYSPWYFVVGSIDELKTLKEKIHYPCIIKPTDNAGSKGVVLVHNYDGLISSYEYSYKYSCQGNVLVEEYLRGTEVSVEMMIVDGVAHILQITDKLTTGAPHFVEMGHSQPSRHPEEIKAKIRKLAAKACAAIGIEKGPAHVEMMITKRGPVMIELGARMGGDNITTALVPLSCGIDMVKATIDVSLGNKPDILPALHCGSAIRYFDVPYGTIKSISGLEIAKKVDGVCQISFTKELGDVSTPIYCSNDRIGFVITQSATAEDAVKLCEKVMKMIHIVIE
ncbi:MAG: ATP-grasp domain-containing protein [Bacteroidales bacterium]|nr:ATP-grasp domain-containing protein [Bacteroidales bacterium]